MSGLSEVVFENVVSSQGHMINVRFFSVVRSVCLFTLKSLHYAVFRSKIVFVFWSVEYLHVCTLLLVLLDEPAFCSVCSIVDETRLVCLE